MFDNSHESKTANQTVTVKLNVLMKQLVSETKGK